MLAGIISIYRGAMVLPVVRTRDEAHLYLDMHPCASCASMDAEWQNSLVTVRGELVTRYSATCHGCSVEREFLFALPERDVLPEGYPTFGGSEPSQLLDAGEWLWVADLAATHASTDESGQALAVAVAAIDEVFKFIPPGQDEVPDTAFWSDRGREVLGAHRARFRRDRLVVDRETYRRLASP